MRGGILNKSDIRGQVCLSFLWETIFLETNSPFTVHELETTKQSTRNVRTTELEMTVDKHPQPEQTWVPGGAVVLL